MTKKKYKTGLSTALQAASPPIDTASYITKRKVPASRAGRVGVTFWVTPEMKQAIAILAAETGYTKQALLEEALNDKLERMGKKRIE